MKIIAHRGCGTLALENKLSAIQKAIMLGFDETEIDIQKTKDGKLAVYHDDTTEHLNGQREYVKDLSFEELQSRNTQERIPLLEEALACSRGKIHLRIDVKSGLAEHIAQSIGGKTQDITIIARDRELLKKLKQHNPHIQTAILVSDPSLDVLTAANESGCDGIHLGNACVNRALLEEAKKRGLEVAIGNYNSPEELDQALAFEPDGIVTDRPDILKERMIAQKTAQERIDIVDDTDTVRGVATREEVRQRALTYRSSQVIVINEKGELFVQKRSNSKDLWPGLYALGVGETVHSKESYAEAATRGLTEEVGLKSKPQFLFAMRLRSPEDNENIRVYQCQATEPLKFTDGEVTEGFFVSEEKLYALFKERHLEFTPVSYLIFKDYQAYKENDISPA